MEKLPEDFKKKWVDALRSGEYQQGVARLYFGNKYCCLGIGCVVQGIDKDFIHALSVPQNIHPDNRATMLELFLSRDMIQPLIDMNDGIGMYVGNRKSFAQIADWIDENL